MWIVYVFEHGRLLEDVESEWRACEGWWPSPTFYILPIASKEDLKLTCPKGADGRSTETRCIQRRPKHSDWRYTVCYL